MAVTVPDAPDRHPVRWDVVAWRLVGSAAVVVAALLATGLLVAAHSWTSWGARLECQEIPGYRARVVRGGWAEANECHYTDAASRTMDARPSPTLGPPNWFEPRLSFVVVTILLVTTWGLTLVALRAIWRTGRVHRPPRDPGRVLVA